MTLIRFFLCVAIVLGLAGCSREDNKPPSQKTTAPAKKRADQASRAPGDYASISDVPEGFRKAAEEFSTNLETAIRDGEVEQIRGAFDRVAIAEAITAGVTSSGIQVSQFKTGLQQGIQKSLGQVATVWTTMTPKYKGLVIYKGALAARYRFTSEQGGIFMIDLVVRTNSLGRLAVVNFCNHALGYDLVEASRQTAAPMLAQLDRSFLERLVNKPGLTIQQIKQFGTLSEKTTAGDYAGAIEVYQGLPDQLKESLPATSLYIVALQRNGDMEAYKRALKEAAARFGSASFRFMLVDAYALSKEFDKAVECVDAFAELVGPDAALLALKGLMLSANGEVANAREVLRKALELEPDCEFVHVKGLDVFLAAKDFTAVRDSLRFLEDNAGYDFKGNLTDPVWADFTKSPESEPWR